MEIVEAKKQRRTKELRLSRIEKILGKIPSYRLFERVDNLEKRLSGGYSPDTLSERITMIESIVNNTKGILTSQEACNYLGFTNSYLYKLTSANKIPYYRPTNGHILFIRQELDDWVKKCKVVGQDE